MVYYYPCFRWRIRDRSRSGISQALKSILQSSTSTQPSFPRFLQAGFYVIGGSQSLRRRTSRLPLWQYPYEYFIRKCRTLQDGFPAFFFFAILSHYVYLSFSFRFPVHLYYPAAVRTFQRHNNPAGTRLPNVTGPFFAPPLRAFHFPDNTTSSPPKYIYCYLPALICRKGTRQAYSSTSAWFPFIVCVL